MTYVEILPDIGTEIGTNPPRSTQFQRLAAIRSKSAQRKEDLPQQIISSRVSASMEEGRTIFILHLPAKETSVLSAELPGLLIVNDLRRKRCIKPSKFYQKFYFVSPSLKPCTG